MKQNLYCSIKKRKQKNKKTNKKNCFFAFLFSSFLENGFSLIQLLTVISIIALMALIAIPSLRQYGPNIKLKAEARQIVSDLRYAQQLTIAQQKVHYVEIDIASRRYTLAQENDPSNPLKTITLTEGISFQAVTGFDNNRVVFNSYGAVSQAGQIILINEQENTHTINVKPSGYVQLAQ
jgi:type II secretory pathway pseudopilin PulG